ncbi:MAG: RluA family pseudouridine synthase [Alphaproteobacteria bacterium]|nr:RluA family pseudouridine synthase [Alphaproteobacteria bacterium]
MSKVQNVTVPAADEGVRLDRWFRRRYPAVTQGRLERLLRTGQVRVDGARVKASHRVAGGEVVRVPPLPVSEPEEEAKAGPKISPRDREFIKNLVIYRDDDVIVLNKPAGLAVQGGTKTERHIDGLLPLLAPGGERPRLVHRLDRDTSGVLVVAANANAAAKLAASFRQHNTKKIYWALTAGVPHPSAGKISAPLVKRSGAGGRERVEIPDDDEDDDAARPAVTEYVVMDQATRFAWVALMPVTGRTHQIRAHCAAIGTPIVGDFKYGGQAARGHGDIANRLHLHARRLRIRHPNGKMLDLVAPLPPHMVKTWDTFGWPKNDKRDPFAR